MKGVLLLLVLGAAGFVGYKYLYKRGDAGPQSPAAAKKFIESCKQLSSTITKVDAYCACLAQGGVVSMTTLVTKPAHAEIARRCQEKVGHVAMPTGDPTAGGAGGAGHPAPTGRGRSADHMNNQINNAFKRRKIPK